MQGQLSEVEEILLLTSQHPLLQYEIFSNIFSPLRGFDVVAEGGGPADSTCGRKASGSWKLAPSPGHHVFLTRVAVELRPFRQACVRFDIRRVFVNGVTNLLFDSSAPLVLFSEEEQVDSVEYTFVVPAKCVLGNSCRKPSKHKWQLLGDLPTNISLNSDTTLEVEGKAESEIGYGRMVSPLEINARRHK
ncbi:uncharacterized protein BDR25DRAFT_309056 [Lindgomyces ingoldianus]|uniref:Uncharacterized protein n=1 Tax=Lindgomyces ingoldianus TaxID=673940 RepID=A0ACB6RHR6_9PLEO|nr:uncharacterized protein BDR25DRAFT_309056 [Lindgomyces ingoldianus]KAF2478270.1 hypothetical protein BDR25DRAFT_309056 [Lindgomyces ingoldianus]